MRRVCLGMIGLGCFLLLFMPASASATLGDSDVQLYPGPDTPDNCYKPGETTTVCFQITNGSSSTEEIDRAEIKFPTTAWTLAFKFQVPTNVLDIHTITDNSIALTPT